MQATDKVGQNPQQTGAIPGVSQKDVEEFGAELTSSIVRIFLMNKKPEYAPRHLASVLYKRW